MFFLVARAKKAADCRIKVQKDIEAQQVRTSIEKRIQKDIKDKQTLISIEKRIQNENRSKSNSAAVEITDSPADSSLAEGQRSIAFTNVSERIIGDGVQGGIVGAGTAKLSGSCLKYRFTVSKRCRCGGFRKK
jgi:hypothetical protein